MTFSRVHFSSQSSEWETPDDLFKKYDDVYHFSLDVCATLHNRKVERYFSPQQDGLAQKWTGFSCWMNPPYGAEIEKWVAKAHAEKGCRVVALLPARTDTRWWHEHVFSGRHTKDSPARIVEFLRGRIKFKGAENSAPFPSAIVVWR